MGGLLYAAALLSDGAAQCALFRGAPVVDRSKCARAPYLAGLVQRAGCGCAPPLAGRGDHWPDLCDEGAARRLRPRAFQHAGLHARTRQPRAGADAASVQRAGPRTRHAVAGRYAAGPGERPPGVRRGRRLPGRHPSQRRRSPPVGHSRPGGRLVANADGAGISDANSAGWGARTVVISAVDRVGNEGAAATVQGPDPIALRPEIIPHSAWEAHPPLGHLADASRRNIAPGDTAMFRDLTVQIASMSADSALVILSQGRGAYAA